jgi:hypothetical protein
LRANLGKWCNWGKRYKGRFDSQSPISSLWSRKTSLSHDCNSAKSNSHLVSMIKWFLSARWILSRSTRGGGKGFSSASVLFYFVTTAIKIPSNQTIVSGDEGGFGQLTIMERENKEQILWCGDKVNDEGKKGEGSFLENRYSLGVGDRSAGQRIS